jgi:hypothetical protein
MKTQENLIQRKIPYQPVSDSDVAIPKEVAGKGMSIPTDVERAVRKLKKLDWEEGKLYSLSKDDGTGQSIFIMLHPDSEADNILNQLNEEDIKKSAPIIVKFTIGERPIWSHYVSNDAPTYYFSENIVDNIGISWSNPEDLPVSAKSISITMGADEITLKKSTKGMYALTGMAVIKEQEFGEFDGVVMRHPTVLEFGILPYGKGAKGCGLDIENENFIEDFAKQYGEGGGTYYFKQKVTAYASPDMYVGTGMEEEFLLPPEVNFGQQSSLSADEAIVFTLVMENPTFTTDNFTGRNSRSPSSKLIETVMFPGDEGLLAPMGTGENGDLVNCGEELPEGRVLKSITPAFDNGEIISVLMEFRDGSKAIFPDEETRTFQATDKETGQMLKGVVQKKGFYKYTGNPRQEYETVKEQRRMRNLNRDFNILVEDANITRAIAWYGGENGEIMEVIVPDPDNASKSILITIPLSEA